MWFCNSIFLSKCGKYSPELRVTIHKADKSKFSPLFISQMRGVVLLNSAICILAVDLHIFPRRYAKTETYGFGPMDLGVGLFTLMMGATGAIGQTGARSTRTLRNIAFLLLLGVLRFVTMRAVDYQQHASEYGLHWNFFFTLAVVRVLAIGGARIKSVVSLVLLIAALVACQYRLLVIRGFQAVCLADSGNRSTTDGLLMANKEGLVSLGGYVILWLVGRLVGVLLARKNGVVKVVVALAVCALAAGAAVAGQSPVAGAVSRRAANLGYVLWTSSSFCWCLCLILCADVAQNWLEDRANYVTSECFHGQ